MQKNENRPFSHFLCKNRLKNKSLNIRPPKLRLPEENVWERLCEIWKRFINTVSNYRLRGLHKMKRFLMTRKELMNIQIWRGYL